MILEKTGNYSNYRKHQDARRHPGKGDGLGNGKDKQTKRNIT